VARPSFPKDLRDFQRQFATEEACQDRRELLPVAAGSLNAFTSERCELPLVASSCCVLPDVASAKRHENGVPLSMITALSVELATGS
jgi:hypothetical protein